MRDVDAVVYHCSMSREKCAYRGVMCFAFVLVTFVLYREQFLPSLGQGSCQTHRLPMLHRADTLVTDIAETSPRCSCSVELPVTCTSTDCIILKTLYNFFFYVRGSGVAVVDALWCLWAAFWTPWAPIGFQECPSPRSLQTE